MPSIHRGAHAPCRRGTAASWKHGCAETLSVGVACNSQRLSPAHQTQFKLAQAHQAGLTLQHQGDQLLMCLRCQAGWLNSGAELAASSSCSRTVPAGVICWNGDVRRCSAPATGFGPTVMGRRCGVAAGTCTLQHLVTSQFKRCGGVDIGTTWTIALGFQVSDMAEQDALQLSFSRWWCAEFVQGDDVGALLADAALLPYFVILFTATCCYCRRQANSMLYVAPATGTQGSLGSADGRVRCMHASHCLRACTTRAGKRMASCSLWASLPWRCCARP